MHPILFFMHCFSGTVPVQNRPAISRAGCSQHSIVCENHMNIMLIQPPDLSAPRGRAQWRSCAELTRVTHTQANKAACTAIYTGKYILAYNTLAVMISLSPSKVNLCGKFSAILCKSHEYSVPDDILRQAFFRLRQSSCCACAPYTFKAGEWQALRLWQSACRRAQKRQPLPRA